MAANANPCDSLPSKTWSNSSLLTGVSLLHDASIVKTELPDDMEGLKELAKVTRV